MSHPTTASARAAFEAKLITVQSRDQLMLVPIRHWTLHDRIALTRMLDPWGLEIVDVPRRPAGVTPLFKIVEKQR